MFTMNYPEKGVSLVITFLIMTIMLSIVVSLSVILYSEVKIMANVGNAVSAFYLAESGAEKTLYYDRKEIPQGAIRGFCSICSTCTINCNNCAAVSTDLIQDGCAPLTCNNCRIKYESAFEDKTYTIDAWLHPDALNPGFEIFNIRSKGFYKDTARSVEVIIGDQP